MTLTPGATVGPFEVLAAIGAGGMGEVYRARDTRLKREVALKVLPDAFAHDPDRLARFQREAELLATLNHPNIAAVYGLEQSDGVSAIVLELVDGETLADLIARSAREAGPFGPAGLPLADALPIARQIAEALEAAHEKGVVHRDLKPGNIKVTVDGRVKVLDFGLAKLLESDADPSALTVSPTLSVHATRAGVILGTAAYMSPEQARGKRVDRRADIWAFGCVLFEMLTGKQAFDPGETVSDAIASVLTKEPDWSALPADSPAAVRTLLRRSLQKDLQKRLPHIGLVRIEIDERDGLADLAPSSRGAGPFGPAGQSGEPARWNRALPWAVAGAVAVALVLVIALWAPWRSAPVQVPLRMAVELGLDGSLTTAIGPAIALSPDGQVLAFEAQPTGGDRPRLYVRRLDQLDAVPLAGTDGGRDPFFSPDGQWIGFFADGKLKKISTSGGTAVTLADAPNSRGASWAEEDTIVFQPVGGGGQPQPLMRVSSAGGNSEPFTELAEGEITHRWPQMLPGGTALLFTAHSSTGVGYEDANIVVRTIADGGRKVLYRGGYFARYLPSGHLLLMRGGTLFAAAFNPDRLEMVGAPVPVVQGVATNPGTGGAEFTVSSTGTLAYVPGQIAGVGRDAPILWMDRQGRTAPLRAAQSNWRNVRFAPHGRSLAIDIVASGAAEFWEDVWVYDWARDTLSRLTFDAARDRNPAWTPDGRRIAFSSQRGDKITENLYWQRADGTGEAQRLTESGNQQLAGSWHPTGRLLAFQETTLESGGDIMILPIDGDDTSGWKPGTPTAFLNTRFNETRPIFSPDGQWLASLSDESGRPEVYVRRFPGPGGRWQVSTDGGDDPVWSRTARELFYRALDSRIMAAAYTIDGEAFRPERPMPVADTRIMVRPGTGGRFYDVHPDGMRFAIASAADEGSAGQDSIVVVLNFFDELRRLVPVR